MKKLLLLLLPLNIYAGAFVYTGDWRAEYGLYHNLDFGSKPDAVSSNSKDYMLTRFRLNPEFIVNDILSIKSEWVMLAGGLGSSDTTDTNAGLVAGANKADLYLNHVWFEWISSFGVFSVGRKGFDFGLGILFDSGSDIWDYTHNYVDRIGYDLKLGSISIGFAYDLYKEDVLNNSRDEDQGSLVRVIYERIDTGLEVGFMWYVRQDMPGVKYNSYDFYQKKSFKDLDLDINWEVVYQNGTIWDSEGNSVNDKLQAFGVALEFLWYPKNFELGLKTGLASGDERDVNDKYYGFTFNTNYSIALLLFNEYLGVGSTLDHNSVHGSNGIGGDLDTYGTIYIAPSLAFSASDKLKFETVYVYAMSQKQSSDNKNKYIGSEIDFNVKYAFLDNFEAIFRTGMFVPSSRFPDRKTAIGALSGIGVKF